MTDENETVQLGMMPASILENTENVTLFFSAEMEKGSGKVRPSEEVGNVVEKSIERYRDALVEHGGMSKTEANEALGLD